MKRSPALLLLLLLLLVPSTWVMCAAARPASRRELFFFSPAEHFKCWLAFFGAKTQCTLDLLASHSAGRFRLGPACCDSIMGIHQHCFLHVSYYFPDFSPYSPWLIRGLCTSAAPGGGGGGKDLSPPRTVSPPPPVALPPPPLHETLSPPAPLPSVTDDSFPPEKSHDEDYDNADTLAPAPAPAPEFDVDAVDYDDGGVDDDYDDNNNDDDGDNDDYYDEGTNDRN